jgi:hypothetical protein
MKPIPTIPHRIALERFELSEAFQPRSAVAFTALSTTIPSSLYSSLRFATRKKKSWMLFSSVFPLLLLWAGQEASTDAGGTWVFLGCCALVLLIFSKTGWRNEPPPY